MIGRINSNFVVIFFFYNFYAWGVKLISFIVGVFYLHSSFLNAIVVRIVWIPWRVNDFWTQIDADADEGQLDLLHSL